MRANLLSLGADCTVSRSKLFQGGGYDVDIGTRSILQHVKPTTTHAKTVYTEHHGEPLAKWSSNQAPGLGLIFYQPFSPKKTNDSGGIMKTRAKPPEDEACLPGDEKRSQACTKRQTTRAKEFYLNIHLETTYFEENDRAKTQLDRSYLELAHEHLTEAVTKPRKLPLEESTRDFCLRVIIHQETIQDKSFCRIKSCPNRAQLGDVQESLLGDKNPREKLTYEKSTRANVLGFEFHQEIIYFKMIYQVKSAQVRVGLRANQGGSKPGVNKESIASNLPSAEATNWIPYMSIRGFPFNPGDTLDQEEALPPEAWYTLPYKNMWSHYLPYLELKEINQQRLFPLSLLCILKPPPKNLDVPRHHNFAPKLSRLKLTAISLFGRFCHQAFKRLFSFNFCDLFLVLDLRNVVL